MLTVLGVSEDVYIDPKRGWKYKKWDCQCDCGNIISVRTSSLTRKDGNGTKSCGCQRMEHMLETRIIHGESNTRLYKIWKGIRKRCYNKNSVSYVYYGERGIKMCDEWYNDYSTFMEWALSHGYEDSLTIDRINVNGDYCPENCRWTTMLVQSNNSRHCHYITYNGETHTISEWARILDISRLTLSNRIINLGWSIEEAFTIPTGKYTASQRNKAKENEYGTSA